MSIASEITRIKNNIAGAYTSANAKGATMPETQNSANLANTINSISVGPDTSDATAVASDILSGKTAYVNEQKLTGTMTNRGSKTFTPSNATQTSGAGYYSGITVNPQTGVDINGIIEEYTVVSGGNVNAGDFVKFVENYTTETELKSSGNYYANSLISVVLSDTSIFIAYITSNAKLNGMICTISGNSITINTEIELATSVSGNGAVSACLLSSTKIFVSYITSSGYLNGMICTISGSTITVNTNTQLSNNATNLGITNSMSSTLVSSNKIFIIRTYNIKQGSSTYQSYLYGIVCTISGTSITTGTDTNLNLSATVPKAITLTNTKVFVTYYIGNTLYGMTCTIGDLTITLGTNTQLGSRSSYSIKSSSIVVLSNSKVFIAYCGSGTNTDTLNGMICTINGNITTVVIDIELSSTKYSGKSISAILLSNSQIFITHGIGTLGNTLNGMLCDINGNTIISGTDLELSTLNYSGYSIVTGLVNVSKIFIAHSSGSYDTPHLLYGMFYEIKISKSTSQLEINGIAKTGATAGNKAQIYVPNV